MIGWLKKIFNSKAHMSWQQREMERYLANSTDLFDLECRQKELTYGRKIL